MGYIIVYDIKDLAIMIKSRLDNINTTNPYKNKYSGIILVRCSNVKERNLLVTELIRSGYTLDNISNKNGLWIKVSKSGVCIESFKKLFIECKKPSYDEIYIHNASLDKFINVFKKNNVKYKIMKSFYFYNENIKQDVKNINGNNKNVNKINGEKVKKEIPKALEGLEVSDDLHSFTYKFNLGGESGSINFYTSEIIDKEKLEELIKICF